MADASHKRELVSKVVDALYGKLFSAAPDLPDNVPDQLRAQIIASRNMAKEHHREFALELFAQHMTELQLSALLDFHTSNLGKSIQEALALIHSRMNDKFQALDTAKNPSLMLVSEESITLYHPNLTIPVNSLHGCPFAETATPA